MHRLFISFLFLMVLNFLGEPILALNNTAELPKCVVKTHCVRVDWKVNDTEASFKKAIEIVKNTPRTEIIEEDGDYIHAEAKTRWIHYIDDLEIKAFPEKNMLQVRSESRVGIGDNGVNQKRIDNLAYRLMTNQTIP